MAVKFNLHRPSQSGDTLIYLVFNYGAGKRFSYSSGEKIRPKFWSAKRQRVKSTWPGYIQLNDLLDKLKTETLAFHRSRRSQGRGWTNKEMKAHLDATTGKREIEGQTDNFLDWVRIMSAKRKASGEYSELTLKVYTGLINHLEGFSKNRRSLRFDDIDLEFFEQFKRHLNDLGLNDNSIGKYIARIKMFMKLAVDRKRTGNTVFTSSAFSVPYTPASKVWLNAEEIAKLLALPIDKKGLSDSRDCLVMACLTGLRYSDWAKVRLNDVIVRKVSGLTFIEVFSQKAKKIVYVPLLSPVMDILERNGGVLPLISNQKTNQYIKTVCRMAGMTEKVHSIETIKSNVNHSLVPKFSQVSTHSGRNSFVTNMSILYAPDQLISIVTGHAIRDRGVLGQYDRSDFKERAAHLVGFLRQYEKAVNDCLISATQRTG